MSHFHDYEVFFLIRNNMVWSNTMIDKTFCKSMYSGFGRNIVCRNCKTITRISTLGRTKSYHFFFFNFILFLLGIFLVYIFNAIPKVRHTHPPQSTTHPLPRFGPGVPLYWGIYSLQVQWASLCQCLSLNLKSKNPICDGPTRL